MTVGDLVYLVGGLDPTMAPIGTVDVFDPILQAYPSTEVMALDGAPFFRFRYASAVDADKIYILGGLDNQEGPPTNGSQQVRTCRTHTPPALDLRGGPRTSRTPACTHTGLEQC